MALATASSGPPVIDAGTPFDWGRTSPDYALHRPGPTGDFYRHLLEHGIGMPGQRILDLGTGTGVLARQFARQGAVVTGADASPEQLAMARSLAEREGLVIRWHLSLAEDLDLPENAFDVATANQCWHYFDVEILLPRLRRMVRGGRLMLSSFFWLPEASVVAARTEELVLRYSPTWQGAGWDGNPGELLDWAEERSIGLAHIQYREEIPFTPESWRGRMRTCRGVGASLPPESVARFDLDLARLLEEIAGESFTVTHQTDICLFALAE